VKISRQVDGGNEFVGTLKVAQNFAPQESAFMGGHSQAAGLGWD
jgi:hypothetical protein